MGAEAVSGAAVEDEDGGVVEAPDLAVQPRSRLDDVGDKNLTQPVPKNITRMKLFLVENSATFSGPYPFSNTFVFTIRVLVMTVGINVVPSRAMHATSVQRFEVRRTPRVASRSASTCGGRKVKTAFLSANRSAPISSMLKTRAWCLPSTALGRSTV